MQVSSNLYNSTELYKGYKSRINTQCDKSNIDNKSLGNEQDVSSKYNARSASFEEFCNISTELYNKGDISLLEKAVMIFNPEESPQQI